MKSSAPSVSPVAESTTVFSRYGFYRPHSRVTFNNELVDDVTGEVTYPPSRTKQSHVAECDINNILKQYRLTGQIRHISAKASQGAYEDLPDPQEFQESMNIVIAAEAAFATLPAHTRQRFGNDPQQFLVFTADPANASEMVRLGLAKAPPPPPVAPDPPSPSEPPTAK